MSLALLCLLALVCDGRAQSWQELRPPDPTRGDGLGNALSIDGELALIGAWNARGARGVSGTGAAFVFRRDGDAWAFSAELEPELPDDTRRFGSALCLDVRTALVSAPGTAAPGGIESAGVVYAFELVGGRWIERQRLSAHDAAEQDFFGYSVSVRGDLALIGAYRDDDAAPDAGSAYLFERVDGRWIEIAELHASDARPGASFGHSLELETDARGRPALAVIGAHRDSEAGARAGAVYVFERVGESWLQVAKLLASTGSACDRLGHSVSISTGSDGVPRILAGARFDGPGGAAYLFERREGRWRESARLRAPRAEGAAEFGWSVRLRADRALCGAFRAQPGRSGAVHLFERTGSEWSALARFELPGAAPQAEFGNAVDLSRSKDAPWALVGAWRGYAGAGVGYAIPLVKDR